MKPNAIKMLLIFCLLWLFNVTNTQADGKHPLHVSTTEISFNAKSHSLEITCRIFTDDFEAVLAKNFKTKIDLSKPAMEKAMDELVKKYLAQRLKFFVNGKPMTAKYIGFENDIEATSVYLEIENINQLQQLLVQKTVLYDLFDDQMSILHVENKGERKSARNNYPLANLEVSFK